MLTQLWSRTSEWWSPKAGFLISVLCINLALSGVNIQLGAQLLFLALVTIIGFGAFGHIVNDWSDLDADRKAGKANSLENRSVLTRFALLILAFGLALAPWFIGLPYDQSILMLLGIEVLLFLAYSVKPIRLKRFPFVAVFLDALYAYAIPVMVLWSSFELTDSWNSFIPTVLLGGWGLLIGLRHILNHHVTDEVNDLASQTPNVSISIGKPRVLKLIRSVIVPIEIVTVFFIITLIFTTDLYLGIGILSIYLLTLILGVSSKFPYVNVKFGPLVLDWFNTTLLGIMALLYLSIAQPIYLVFVLVFLLLFTDVIVHPALHTILVSSLRLIRKFIIWPFQQISLVGNWSLYYFRKWILGWPEERNWGKHYAHRQEEQRLNAKGNIAIFNQNYEKYSETFINGQTNALDYRTFYYYGWPKPIFEQKVGNLLGSSEYVIDLKRLFLRFLNIGIDDFEDDRIAQSLIENDVKIIIAHFGPMGVKLLNVSRKTGIPIIVVFHGYDAWNKGQLEVNKVGYQELFETAACVIGVSKDICGQLEKLGCAEDKINYLPDFVSPKFMTPSETENSKSEFLSVGRFSRTKSPHLLILAFASVLEKIPSARLTMIGHDDGEGLFEACQILARSLGVSESINFKGTCSADQVLSEMQNNPIFVQHSLTTPLEGDKEGTPVAIMEAMAMGLPIIATNHAGIGEMIEQKQSGLLVSEFDHKKMAEEMVRVAQDGALRKKLGKNAAEFIRSNELVCRSLERFSAIVDKHKIKE